MTYSFVVTGASGFIGGRIAFSLATSGRKVFAPLRNGSRLLLDHRNIICTSYENLQYHASQTDVHTLFHCASLTPANCTDANEISTANERLCKTILDWILYLRPRLTIHTSTVSVYGSIIDPLLTYTTIPINPNSYGLSKLFIERSIEDRGNQLKLSYANLRLPGTVGFGSHGNIITTVIQHFRRFKYLTNPEPLPLYNPHSLFNNIVSISDLLCYVHFLINSCNNESLSVSTILAAKEPVSFLTAISELAQIHSLELETCVDWLSNLSTSFHIDTSHSFLHGYTPMTTLDSLRDVCYDINTYDSTECLSLLS